MTRTYVAMGTPARFVVFDERLILSPVTLQLIRWLLHSCDFFFMAFSKWPQATFRELICSWRRPILDPGATEYPKLDLTVTFTFEMDSHSLNMLCNRSNVRAVKLLCVLQQVPICISFLTSPQPCPTKSSVGLFLTYLSTLFGQDLQWCVCGCVYVVLNVSLCTTKRKRKS